ncbi:MAG: HTH-type transcriptional regulator PuuR [Pelotomaculum sp. PtaU1.Bin065]|nr:MAG: HTH-type transcriptional regulator PuuR [Pelotomaculum sp. PtaU1.Bin065]
MNIGQKIKSTREAQGVSMNALAKRSGASQSAISEIEAGKRQPTFEVLERIITGLGLTLSQFFADKDQKLYQLPPEIWKLVVDKNNYGLLKQIQAMKNKGYSNEVIIEWLTSLENTLENIKTSGVFWGGEDLEESQKYTKQEKQEIIKGLNKKLNDPNFKPPWKKNNVE